MSGPVGSSQWMYNAGGYYDYEIENSLRSSDARNTSMAQTFSSGSQRKYTIAAWVKTSLVGNQSYTRLLTAYVNDANWTMLGSFNNEGAVGAMQVLYSRTGNSSAAVVVTTRRFWDPSAWYHVVIAVDTTQATNTNRVRLWVNGVEETALVGNPWPSQNQDIARINTAMAHRFFGAFSNDTGMCADGNIAEAHFLDGTALTTASAFGELSDNADWVPKEVTGLTYGTNGFYLDFADSGDLGDDESGQGNDWAETNFAAYDQSPDTPTNNFCTWNYIDQGRDATTALQEANLEIGNSDDGSSGDGNEWCFKGTIGVTSGKWYMEYCKTNSGTDNSFIGFGTQMINNNGTIWNGQATNSLEAGESAAGFGISNDKGFTKYGSSTSEDTPTLASRASGTIYGLAVNLDDGEASFYVNGTQTGGAGTLDFTIPTQTHFVPLASQNATWHKMGYIANFGQDSSFAGKKTAQNNSDGGGIGDFYYTPPSGFKALCTYNLPKPAVIPGEHFNTVIYTGDGNSTHAITGVGFEPGMVSIHCRSGTPSQTLQDAIRTPDATLYPNSSEGQNATRAYVNSFDADGFTTGNAAGASKGPSNENNATYVAWCWKAGGTGSANTDGTIDSTVSVDSAGGFSIVQYVGVDSQTTTVGHGLSKAPEIVIVKAISENGRHWRVCPAVGSGPSKGDATDYLKLNSGAATADDDNYWNDTAPTSTVFSVGDANDVNDTDCTFIAYCWHSVEGYSKMGSYNGNGGTGDTNFEVNGETFVHCGFRPGFVMIRRKDSSTGDWYIFDSKRNTYNYMDKFMKWNSTDAEDTENTGGYEIWIDFVSNGFKLRGPSGGINGSSGHYIYMAFAETPFKYANAR